jgi:hypothetical protein
MHPFGERIVNNESKKHLEKVQDVIRRRRRQDPRKLLLAGLLLKAGIEAVKQFIEAGEHTTMTPAVRQLYGEAGNGHHCPACATREQAEEVVGGLDWLANLVIQDCDLNGIENEFNQGIEALAERILGPDEVGITDAMEPASD